MCIILLKVTRAEILLSQSLLLAGPPQHHRNVVFLAEKCATKFRELSKRPSSPVSDQAQRIHVAQTEAIKHTLPLITGSRAWSTITEYIDLVSDFEGPAWDGWAPAIERAGLYVRAEELKGSCFALCAIGVTFRQLVLPSERCKVKLLAFTEVGLSFASVMDIVNTIFLQRHQCSKCVDSSFS